MDHVSAGSGVSDFDTTSSVAGGAFKSNISLVDPTVQFSRTEKRLVEWGVFHQSKICFYIHFRLLLLLLIIKGSGYGFGNNIRDVLFRKVISGPLLRGLRAIFRKVSNFLAVVALPSFGSCLL